MTECNHPNCSRPLIKPLDKAHSFLCDKSSHYHNWHHNPHHRKVHGAALAVYVVAIFGLILQNLIVPANHHAQASASRSWDMATSGDYTNSDSSKIEFSSGAAQLKSIPFSATGGDTTATSGDYTIKTFTQSGTFTANTSVVATEVLVVAGGGGGGSGVTSWNNGGGGGAGGLIDQTNYTVPAGANTVTVGGGGPKDTNGDNSVFASITATGGGKGGGLNPAVAGGNGGSGGGGGFQAAGRAAGSASPSGQGNGGSNGAIGGNCGGGGGGFSEAGGVDGSGAGGDGVSNSITGSPVFYAGGGGGGNDANPGVGGDGGGGGGAVPNVTAGTGQANTGGGGGGGASQGATTGIPGRAGGSGIVVIKYLTAASSYAVDNPTLVSNTGQPYASISAFTETQGAGSTGTIKYQISPDDGATWYWYTGGAWTTTATGYTEANVASDINSNISTFTAGSAPKVFKWRAYFNSANGIEQPKLDNIALTYVWDETDPDNPTLNLHKSQSSGGADITTNTWYGHPAPYFTWNAPSDNAGAGEALSGIAGYYVYFGTSASGDPSSAKGIATELGGSGVHFQTDTDFDVGTDTSAMTSGQTYYLRIETKDNAGNIHDIASGDSSLFIYKYDGTAPTSPTYVSVSPSGYSRTNAFTFTWPAAEPDVGGSTFAGYQYKTNSGAWSNITTDSSVALADIATTGVNVFYLRAIDVAGNVDESPTQTNFYFNDTAPLAPSGTNGGKISVSPASSDQNSFTFSWIAPPGEIAGYYYSVNEPPTLGNTTFTTATTAGPDAFATRQGENIFYLVAKDNAGNYDFSGCSPSSVNYNPGTDTCAAVAFTANTSAPGIPSITQQTGIVDGSNRDLEQYKVFISWQAPESLGTGFAGYEIYRSTDGASFSSIGTTSGTTYADTGDGNNGLESRLYYYRIKSKDNAGQYSASSATVSITPTGRYTNPPALTEGPTAGIKTYSTTITWETDRKSSSFVDYGLSQDKLGATNGGDTKGQLDSVTKHDLTLTGLLADTTYYYKSIWVDSDGNQGSSSIYSFKTNPAPTVSEVDSGSNITLSSILLNWKTTVISNCSVAYGTSTAYGGVLNESSSTLANSHSLNIINLDHSTPYHLRVSCTDSEGNKFYSDDYKESTLTMPKIENLRFESIPDVPTTTLKITWTTNVETTSVVSYQSGGNELSKSDAEYKLTHEITISDLADKTTYVLAAKGVDRHGNIAGSDVNTFTTPVDTRPPKIGNLVVEIRSSGVGTAQKAQLVVSWETDEPSTSQVEYGPGIASDSYPSKSQEDASLTTNHVVIVSDLEAAKLYHLRAISKDTSGNAGKSIDTTSITGKVQSSVVDVIMNSLSRSFGFLSKLNFLNLNR